MTATIAVSWAGIAPARMLKPVRKTPSKSVSWAAFPQQQLLGACWPAAGRLRCPRQLGSCRQRLQSVAQLNNMEAKTSSLETFGLLLLSWQLMRRANKRCVTEQHTGTTDR